MSKVIVRSRRQEEAPPRWQDRTPSEGTQAARYLHALFLGFFLLVGASLAGTAAMAQQCIASHDYGPACPAGSPTEWYATNRDGLACLSGVSMTQVAGDPPTNGVYAKSPVPKFRVDACESASGYCDLRPFCTDLEQDARKFVGNISVQADIHSASTLNGTYILTQGLPPDYPNATSWCFTGEFTLSSPGTYTLSVVGQHGMASWCDYPYSPLVAPLGTVYVRDDATNQGVPDCRGKAGAVGEPINVTNGNMYIQQGDYSAPGPGAKLQILRTYNSLSTRSGLFGLGWSTDYDESLQVYSPLAEQPWVRLNLADGRAVYFSRASRQEPFLPVRPAKFHGTIVANADGTYLLTLKDGTLHQFSGQGKLSWIRDRHGNQTSLAYDASGRLLTVTDAVGHALTFSYATSTSLQVTAVADAAGTVATYTYSVGRLSRVSYPDGSRFDFSYVGTYNSGYGQIGTVKDALGNVLESHTYDSKGRALTSERANGVERVALSYVSGTETVVTDALGRVTSYAYDVLAGPNAPNIVTHVNGPCNCGTSGEYAWTYDDRANVTSESLAPGETTTFSYDADGNLLTETDPMGSTVRRSYNAFGQVLSLTDALGGVRTFTYDGVGNLVSTTDEVGSTTTLTYDPTGLPLSVTDANGNMMQFGYDASGNLIRRTDALGNATAFTYDARGRVTGVTDPLGQRVGYAYDARGRLTTLTQPDGTAFAYTYDLAGRPTRVTDPGGRATTFGYDSAYRLTTVTDALGGVTTYAYDAVSRLTSLTDAKGHATTITYDLQGRVAGITYPGGASEAFTYDLAGRLATRTDRKGTVTTYTHNAGGLLVGKTYSDATPAVTFTYDVKRRLIAAANGTDALTWTYDAADRLLSETSNRNGSVVSYTYDGVGNRTSLSLNGTPFLGYAYDPVSRLTTLTQGGSLVSFAYDAASRQTSMTAANGVVTRYTYDPLARVTSLQATLGTTTVAEHGYSYAGSGNRVTKTTPLLTEQYAYDPIDRLTQVAQTPPGGGPATTTERYAYDAVGNRLSALGDPTWTYDAANRLLAHGGESFAYDANGNLTSSSDPTGVRTYEWNAENQLTRVLQNGSEVVRFGYDPLGRRVETSAGGLTTTYTYDGQAILREGTSAGTVTAYVHGPGIDEPLARQDTAGAWSFYHADGLGSIVAVTDALGAVTGSRSYDAFGNLQGATATPGYAFTGREWEPETGLYYYRARYYDPTIGRFISEDPLPITARALRELNAYAYVGNNPLSFSDPSGLKTCTCNASFSGVGPNQAKGIGALGFAPPNDSVAISPEAFGLPYGTISERIATQKIIRDNIGNIRISAPGLADYLTGSTTFTIGDVGDRNIRNSPTTRFDIYRFETVEDALSFGKPTVPTTITGVPDDWTCPK